VARANLEFIFKNQGSSWNFVDCGLILDKDQGFFAKGTGMFWFGFVFQWEMGWTRSMAHGPWRIAGPS
jgi:hypothetical protein